MSDISRAGRGRHSGEPAPAWLAMASNIATKSSAVARSRAPPEISELLQIDDRAGSLDALATAEHPVGHLRDT